MRFRFVKFVHFMILPTLLLGAIVGSARPVAASTFYPRDFPATLTTTPNVVRGRVLSTRSDFVRTPDGGQQLYTFSEIEVTEVLKGNVEAKRVTVRELGGSKNGTTMEIPGTSRFAAGEDVVTLLADAAGEKGAEAYPILNMSFGKLMVEKNADGREVLRGPALTGPPPSGGKDWTIGEMRGVIADPAAAIAKTSAVLMDARATPMALSSPTARGKSGLITDGARPLDPKPSPSATPASSDAPGGGLSKRTIVIVGIVAGILFFLRTFLKKR